jgi:hypothetical protein
VKDSQGNLVLGRTRWRRFAAVAVPAAVLGAGLMAGVANGAVPIALSVSGQSFKVSADRLEGTGFAQYPGVVVLADNKTTIPVAASAIDFATLKNLCQSVKIPHTSISLIIRGGQGEKEVTADNLLIGVDQLGGEAVFTNIHIGTDASKLVKGGPGANGSPGDFGQEADKVVIDDLRQIAYSTTAGTFSVQGLTLKIDTNGTECFDTVG